MNDKINLKKFIDENHNLLTSAGVFAALTAFFSSSYKENEYISFATFIIFLLLCWEIWTSFPKSEKASNNLKFFEFIFMLLCYGIAFQILMSYKNILLRFSPLIFFGIYSFLIIKVVNRFRLYLFVRNFADKHKGISPLIRSLPFLFIFGVALVLAISTSKELIAIIN